MEVKIHNVYCHYLYNKNSEGQNPKEVCEKWNSFFDSFAASWAKIILVISHLLWIKTFTVYFSFTEGCRHLFVLLSKGHLNQFEVWSLAGTSQNLDCFVVVVFCFVLLHYGQKSPYWSLPYKQCCTISLDDSLNAIF